LEGWLFGVGISTRHALGAPYANEFTCAYYLFAEAVIEVSTG